MSVLQRLRELEAAATPAPWRWIIDDDGYLDPSWKYEQSDDELLIAARNALPLLLDIAEAADAFLASFVGAAPATFVAACRLSNALAALEAQEAT